MSPRRVAIPTFVVTRNVQLTVSFMVPLWEEGAPPLAWRWFATAKRGLKRGRETSAVENMADNLHQKSLQRANGRSIMPNLCQR
jgi:hypothetical protein